MSLPTNRMPGDLIQSVDINQIAEAVNDLSDSGTSGPMEIPWLENTDLNDFTAPFASTGMWRASLSRGVTNFPPSLAGGQSVFTSYRFTSTDGIQRWLTVAGQDWQRVQSGGSWSEWVRVDATETRYDRGLLPDGTDLNTVIAPGAHRAAAGRTYPNAPWPATSFTLEALNMGASWGMQRATDQNGNVRFRSRVGSSGMFWGPWTATSVGAGAQSRTALESAGDWTSLAQEDTYLTDLTQNREVTALTLGQSVENRPIRAIRIGDPAKPAVLFLATQHGDEVGPREGLLMFAREVAQATSLALLDVCVLIVPTVNPDRYDQTRSNANGVNLNRDWVDRTQPETQAIVSLFGSHNVVAAVDLHNFGYMREVALRGSRTGPAPVQTAAGSLYDAVWAAYERDGQAVRMYGEPDDAITEGTVANGLALTDRIPGLLVEIPYHRNVTNPHTPVPHWHAHAALTACRAALDHVWRNRASFTAAKADTTMPALSRSWAPYYTRSEVDQLIADVAPKDTGQRDITTLASLTSGGPIYLRRIGNVVSLTGRGLAWASGQNTLLSLPSGFRPSVWEPNTSLKYWSSEATYPYVVKHTGPIDFLSYTGTVTNVRCMWFTSDPWPTTLPGVPA